MSALALVQALAAASCLAVYGSWLHGRRKDRKAVRVEAMAAQHHGPPYVHRLSGRALAVADDRELWHEGPTEAQMAEWESDDCLPADDTWCAYWAPGSLGAYPEQRPGADVPLPVAAQDVEDLLTGAIRLLRDMAR